MPKKELAELHPRDSGDRAVSLKKRSAAASNRDRRIDFALFMVEALDNDELIHQAPAIVGRQTASALAHAAFD